MERASDKGKIKGNLAVMPKGGDGTKGTKGIVCSGVKYDGFSE